MATSPSSGTTRDDKEAASALETTRPSLLSRVHLLTDVDPAAATIPMIAYCFMTGWLYALPLQPSRSVCEAHDLQGRYRILRYIRMARFPDRQHGAGTVVVTNSFLRCV
jgi:hypothetical protein